jgi:molecular chaperone DnaK
LFPIKKDKIIVGKQSQRIFGKQKKDVVTQAFFKRKMGTSESFKIKVRINESNTY